MDVLIYVDEGVVDRSRLETPRSLSGCLAPERHPVRIVDRTYFRTPNWERSTAAVVMPGGRDVPYCAALAGEANARIRAFVENGGTYIGFCAGAYYGAAHVEFDVGCPLEVRGERELRLFPGAAVGPAYGKGTFDYASDTGARAAALMWCPPDSGPRNCTIFYNGGCFFHEPERHAETTVLARYADLPGNPAAIVSSAVGTGRAILSGVHPEYSARSFRGGSPALAAIHTALREEEAGRLWLLRELLRRAGLTLSEAHHDA